MQTKVTLVAVTKPSIEGIETLEEYIAYVARVSNPSNQMNTLTSGKLLKYLVDNKHWSPFEMASITMGIETTRDIGRQILRHRSFSFQEFSQRYANATELGITVREARLQDAKNRQASNPTDDIALLAEWERRQLEVIKLAREAYSWGIENGIAKEQTRAVLPEGNTNSRLYMAGTVRSWIHYCQIRTEIGTQKEHRDIAVGAQDVLTQLMPSISHIIKGTI